MQGTIQFKIKANTDPLKKAIDKARLKLWKYRLHAYFKRLK